MISTTLLQSRAIIKCVSRLYCCNSRNIDVKIDEKTGISTVTMQRKPVNSLNLEFMEKFIRTLEDLEKERIKGMILTSGIDRVFCGGLELSEICQPNPDRLKKFVNVLFNKWLAHYNTPYPTVAAINGNSPAGGCVIALCCDYRIMVDKFKIGLNETQVGIAAPKYIMTAMSDTIGRRNAELALTTGKLYTTSEAFQIGLIDEIAQDKDDALNKANEFLLRIIKVPAMARALTKRSLRQEATTLLENNFEKQMDDFLNILLNPECQAYIKEFFDSLKKK